MPYYISPVQAVIEYMETISALTDIVGTQIGTRHKFTDESGGWDRNTPALTFRADGGISKKYTREQPSNLECIAWAPTHLQGYSVYGVIVETLRDFVRTEINGALIQILTVETQPTQLVDPETGIPQIMFFMDAQVGENIST